VCAGNELNGGAHTIPKCYGALEPTAVFVPLKEMRKARVFPLATREVFGPLQVVTEYRLRELDSVLEVCERMHAHLTAAVVSRDEQFRCVARRRGRSGSGQRCCQCCS
jgi:1-pyrroline-5-carboxylate dehydrogenase